MADNGYLDRDASGWEEQRQKLFYIHTSLPDLPPPKLPPLQDLSGYFEPTGFKGWPQASFDEASRKMGEAMTDIVEKGRRAQVELEEMQIKERIRMTSTDNIKKQIAYLYGELEKRDRWGDDIYEDSEIIAFTKTFTNNHHAGEYYYAAIKADGKWYITGNYESGHPRTWEELIEWFDAKGSVKDVRVVVKTKKLGAS